MQLVERIEKLSTFIKNYDENNVFIERAVNKLIDYEKSKIENELTQLKFDLKKFEEKYKKRVKISTEISNLENLVTKWTLWNGHLFMRCF